jgi:hypothetical protein
LKETKSCHFIREARPLLKVGIINPMFEKRDEQKDCFVYCSMLFIDF